MTLWRVARYGLLDPADDPWPAPVQVADEHVDAVQAIAEDVAGLQPPPDSQDMVARIVQRQSGLCRRLKYVETPHHANPIGVPLGQGALEGIHAESGAQFQEVFEAKDQFGLLPVNKGRRGRGGGAIWLVVANPEKGTWIVWLRLSSGIFDNGIYGKDLWSRVVSLS